MVEITLAESEFIEDLCSIYHAARLETSCYPDVNQSMSDFIKLVENEVIYIAFDGKIKAGFASVCAPDKFIHHLYVLPKYQGQGIGRKLLEHCLDNHGSPMTLKCDACNLRATQFYKTCGLVVISEGVGDYGVWNEFNLKSLDRNA